MDPSPSGPERVLGDEPRWHASLAVLAALVLYITLPPRLTLGPIWLPPVLVLVLLIPLSILGRAVTRKPGARASPAFC